MTPVFCVVSMNKISVPRIQLFIILSNGHSSGTQRIRLDTNICEARMSLIGFHHLLAPVIHSYCEDQFNFPSTNMVSQSKWIETVTQYT